MSEHPPEGRLDRSAAVAMRSDVRGFDRHEQFLGAEPSNSVHPLVRIVDGTRWHEGVGVDQDHRTSSAGKISSVRFAKLGSLLVKRQW
jgi:hypothetical protein